MYLYSMQKYSVNLVYDSIVNNEYNVSIPWHERVCSCHGGGVQFKDRGDIMPMRHRHQAVDGRVWVATEFVSHGVGGRVSVHLRGQILTSGQMFESEQAVPMPCPSSAWVVLDHLQTQIFK